MTVPGRTSIQGSSIDPSRVTCPRLLIFAMGLCVSLLVACSEPPRDVTDPGSTITVLSCCEDWWAWNVPSHHLVFLSLFHDHAGDVEGRLVQDWESSPDNKTWTYRLHPDATWHDGVPVTARDVQFTLNLLSHPERLDITPGSVRVEVLDDRTFTLTFPETEENPWSWTPLEADFPVLPRHLLQDLDPAELSSWEFWRHPVGSGPYRFVRAVEHTMVELESDPRHFAGKPRIDRVILKFQQGAPGQLQLEAGETDVADIYTLDARAAFNLGRQELFTAYWRLMEWSYVIEWNLEDSILGGESVRRALAMAVNRRELAALLDYPEEVPLFDVPLSAYQRIRRDYPNPLPCDPEGAVALLDSLGWHLDPGSQIRTRNGKTLQFTLLAGGWNAQQLAVLIQAQLRAVGAGVEVETLNPTAIPGRRESGSWGGQVIIGFTGEPVEIINLLSRAPANEVRRRALALMEDAASAVVGMTQDSLYREMWPYLRQDAPVTFLVPNLLPAVAHTRVKGLANHERVSASRHMHELWIEEGGR